jgi:hypothetical protein
MVDKALADGPQTVTPTACSAPRVVWWSWISTWRATNTPGDMSILEF